MLLCLDFGNTSLKYAVCENEKIVQHGTLCEKQTKHQLEEVLSSQPIKKSILSSVVKHSEDIDQLLQEKTNFHRVGIDSKVNFSMNNITNPASIGADRVAICCAAVALQKKTPTYKLVIAAGSCITYNFLTLDNEFMGGGISPGIQMRYRSLNEHTYLLPFLDIPQSFPLVGYDTDTNIHSGVLWGAVGEINYIIELYQQQYSELAIMLTGGDSLFLSQHLKNQIFADPYLVLRGLQYIAHENL